jgi:two-component system cell cycle sensor histidine kinase/response regulator CckA
MGEDALEVATGQNPPDLILLDIMMPGMDGYEVCQRLKSDPSTFNIPVIFISARSEHDDEARGLGLGAVDYIKKPFCPSIVKARVRTHLELKKYRNRLEELVKERTAELEAATRGLQAEIAERKLVEAALRESEEKYRNVVENGNEGILVAQDGRLVFVNKAICDQLGYTKEELTAVPDPFTFIYPDDRELVLARHMKRLKGEKVPDIYEFRVLTKEGEAMWVRVTGVQITWEGKPATLNFFGDIHDRMQAEEALRISEERYRLLVENANDAIFIVQDQLIRFADPKTEALFGYKEEELLRMSFIDFVHREDKARVLEALKNNLTQEEFSSTYSFRIVNGAGEEFWGELNTASIMWEGRPAILNFLRDITVQKKLESQLQQAQKLEALGTLAGGVAHDFNNVLMAIQGRAAIMLRKRDASDPDFEHLDEIGGYVQKAADLTRQLLSFARGGKHEVEPTDINNLIEESAKLFERTKKEISIHLDCQERVWTLEVDRGQIDQVLLNLFINAWHAMPGGGDIHIKTENVTLNEHFVGAFNVKPGKYVRISIADAGVGMDEATRHRIFEPFFTTREMGKGSGLGLSSAYGIIKNHGGFIDVYSEVGQGATFNIYLPATEMATAKEEARVEDIVTGAGTILLVDDEDMIIDIGKALIEELGYKVLVARSGREAVKIYREKNAEIDLVVLDVVMPDMGGGKTYDRLREIDSGVRVLLLSGYSISGQATEMLYRGCDGFIQKPFDLEKLSRKLGEILGPEQ